MSQKNNTPEFDPNAPFEVVEASSDIPEFDPNQPFEEVEKEAPQIGQLEALGMGIEQGSTLGTSDEIQGGIGAGTDAVQSLLHKIGLTGPSASQVNAKLKAEGFTGDIGPTSLKETYVDTRNDAREEYKAGQDQHFYTSLAGNLAGGVGMGMGVGALAKAGSTAGKAGMALLNPVKVAKDAGLATKIGAGVANSVTPSALAGAGISEAELTSGDPSQISQLGNDVFDSVKLGAVLGGAIPVGIAGIKGVGSAAGGIAKLVPDNIRTALKRGAKGTNLAEADIDNNIRAEVNSTVDEVAPMISDEQGAQKLKDQELSDWFLKQVNQVKSSLEGGTMQIEDEAAKATKLQRYELLKDNKELKNKLAKELQVTEAQMDTAIREQSDLLRTEIKQIRGQVKGELDTQHKGKVKSALETEEQIQAKLLEKRAQLETNLEQSKISTTQQISELQDDVARTLDLEKQKQIATNEGRLNDLKKLTVEQAKKLQAKVGAIKKQLGDEYNNIEASADQAAVRPENRDVIGDLQVEIQQRSFLPENEQNTILKRLDTFVTGDRSYANFKALKSELNNLFSHPNLTVRRSAKQAFKKLHENYATALDEAGQGDLSAKIRDTNLRWSAAMDIEDDFVAGTQNDRVVGEILAEPKTIGTIEKFAQNSPAQMADAEAFTKKLSVLTPDQAPQEIDEITALAKQMQQAKDFKPNVPSKDDAFAQNPEINRLQSLLNEIKAGRPINDATKSLSEEINVAGQELDKAKLALTEAKAAKPSAAEFQAKLDQVTRYQELVDTLKKLKQTKATGTSGNQDIDGLLNKANDLNQQLDQVSMDRLNIPNQVVSKTERLAGNEQYQKMKSTLDTVKKAKNVPETSEDLQTIRSIIKDSLGDEAANEFDTMVASNMAPEDSLVRAFDKNPDALKDTLTKLLPKYTRGDDVGANKIDKLLKFLGEKKGPKYAEDFTKRLKGLADDVFIRDAAKVGRFRTTYVANQVGRVGRPFTKVGEFLTKGTKYLTDLDDAGTTKVANVLRGKGATGEAFARVLDSTVGKSQHTKNAIVFGLMQQPGFRDLIGAMENDETENGK